MSSDKPSTSTSSVKDTEEQQDLNSQKVLSRQVRARISRDFEQDNENKSFEKYFAYNTTSRNNITKLANSLRDEPSSVNDGPRTEKTKNAIKTFSPSYFFKLSELKRKVSDLREIRKPFIEKLEEYINKLDQNSKQCSYVRLFSSAVDVAGSAGGLLLSSESNWTKYAFNSASACGFLGAISTVMEMSSSKTILDKISDMGEEDYKLFVCVVEWFRDNAELDSVVQDLFPHGIDCEVALQIQKSSKDLDGYLKIFHSVILSNLRSDYQLLGDEDFLTSLRIFSQSDFGVVWWNRTIFRQHPFDLDLNRMALQMEFGQMKRLLFQSIPALPLEQQRLNSLPVAGRIMLNFLTMYDAFSSLRSGAGSPHSEKLWKLLRKMKRELRTVDEALADLENAHQKFF